MNNLIIVVEGADLVGKTSVIREVIRKCPEVIRVKFDRIPVDLRTDNTYGQIMRYADDTVYKIISQIKDKIFLMDRFIISELIYSDFLKRESHETIKDIINKELYIIILTAKEDILIERIKQRYEDIFIIDEILELNKLFFNFFFKYYNKIKYLYHFENNNQQDLFHITSFIRKMIKYEGKY